MFIAYLKTSSTEERTVAQKIKNKVHVISIFLGINLAGAACSFIALYLAFIVYTDAETIVYCGFYLLIF